MAIIGLLILFCFFQFQDGKALPTDQASAIQYAQTQTVDGNYLKEKIMWLVNSIQGIIKDLPSTIPAPVSIPVPATNQ